MHLPIQANRSDSSLETAYQVSERIVGTIPATCHFNDVVVRLPVEAYCSVVRASSLTEGTAITTGMANVKAE
jgi:hypothetical protein